jgi:hypothetical protein
MREMYVANVTVECMKCRVPVIAPAPLQEMVNRPNTSILIIEHGERFVCKACGTELTLAVGQAQVILVGMPAPPRPSGLLLA